VTYFSRGGFEPLRSLDKDRNRLRIQSLDATHS